MANLQKYWWRNDAMTASSKAIIILYKGRELPNEAAQEIVAVLGRYGVTIPEMVDMTYKDKEAIAQALLRDSKSSMIEIHREEEPDAVTHAVVYIGELFKMFLADEKDDLTTFTVMLLNKCKDQLDSELLAAVEIIGTTEYSKIRKNVAKKYHFTPKVYNIIKHIYDLL